MNIDNMTRRQFEELPLIEEDNVDVDSIVLLPTKRLHDSGYNYYGVVICNKHEAIGRCEYYDIFAMQIDTDILRIDCLHKSGLMRIVVQPNKYKAIAQLHTICKKEIN